MLAWGMLIALIYISMYPKFLYGMAADIDTHTREGNIELFNLIAKNLSFDQLIDEKDYSWIHVSFDPKRLRNQILHL